MRTIFQDSASARHVRSGSFRKWKADDLLQSNGSFEHSPQKLRDSLEVEFQSSWMHLSLIARLASQYAPEEERSDPQTQKVIAIHE